jgi:hypothetical protein
VKSTVARRLACPACGDLLGDAIYRRWPGSLTIRAEAGYSINPISAGIVRRMVEREAAEATSDAARQSAQARLEYVAGNITDPLYDLRCPRGHSTIRTTPAIIRAMTTAQGTWAVVE